MIRKATREDLPRLFEIRAAVDENKLADPNRVTVADAEWFIDHSAFWLWIEDDGIRGFTAADPRDGTIFALFVEPAYQGRGIAQRLLPLAFDTLRDHGHRTATLTTDPSTRAEKLYRRGGWVEVGRQADGQIVFKKNI